MSKPVLEKEGEAPWLIKAKDAAKLLSLSDRKLWELTNRGVIPCIRIGRSVRYDVVDLRFWIEQRKKSNQARRKSSL
jgi:excisionase family DNA binding protein